MKIEPVRVHDISAPRRARATDVGKAAREPARSSGEGAEDLIDEPMDRGAEARGIRLDRAAIDGFR